MPSRVDLRERIAAAAVLLVGTPFRMQGRAPGHGLDCLGVVACAGRAAGLACAEPVPRYGSYPGPACRQENAGYLDDLPLADAGPGDVALIRIGLRLTHCGVIVGDGRSLVHALSCAPRLVLLEPLATLRWPVVAALRYREE